MRRLLNTRGPLCAAISAVLLAAPSSRRACAYFSDEAGQPPQDVTTIEELQRNGQEKLAKEVRDSYKRNAGKTDEQLDAEFKAEQEKAAQEKAEREAESPDRPRLSKDEKKGSPEDPPADQAKTRMFSAEGGSALSQLKGSSGGAAAAAVPSLDAGGPVAPPPMSAGAEVRDEPSRIRANIDKICESKAHGERAKALCREYLNEVAFQKARFDGWLGNIQRGMLRDIRNGSVSRFPEIRFADVPQGAAATWTGDPNGGADAEIAMGKFLSASSAGTKKILDHEMRHHADSGIWDGTPIGDNPLHDVEPPAYATMGCLNAGSCSKKI